MPRYIDKGTNFTKGRCGATAGCGQNIVTDITGGDVCSAYCATVSIDFFDILVDKLYDMTSSFKNCITDLSTKALQQTSGIILGEITLKPLPVGIKLEYVEYIKRYGPPANGIFDQAILAALRIELKL